MKRAVRFITGYLLGTVICIGMSLLYGWVEGLISPEYFELLDKRNPTGIVHFPPALVALMSGLTLSVPTGMAVGAWMAVKQRIPFAYILRGLGTGVLLHFCCWVAGGLIGGSWAALGTASYLEQFPVMNGAQHFFHVGFVGGAIYGAYPGIIAGIAGAIYSVKKNMRHWQAREAQGVLDYEV